MSRSFRRRAKAQPKHGGPFPKRTRRATDKAVLPNSQTNTRTGKGAAVPVHDDDVELTPEELTAIERMCGRS